MRNWKWFRPACSHSSNQCTAAVQFSDQQKKANYRLRHQPVANGSLKSAKPDIDQEIEAENRRRQQELNYSNAPAVPA